MKRFHELTKEQQDQAIEFAKQELKELISVNIICSDRPMTDENIHEFATIAAEDAFYSEKTDAIIEGIADENA